MDAEEKRESMHISREASNKPKEEICLDAYTECISAARQVQNPAERSEKERKCIDAYDDCMG